MKNARTGRVLSLRMPAFSLTLLGLLAACVSAPDHPDWIHVGVTTKNEVITRYGQPDWVIASPGGDIAIYRPTTSGSPATRLEIPTAQAGPFGAATTGMQPIDPGLGAKDLNEKSTDRVWKEIRIRYDDRGVVQELSSP